MKEQILKRLRECDGFVSGQELCDTFGVSRTAVWKVINQLKDEGYEIESVNKKGYRLTGYPDVITAAEIASRLHTKYLGQQVRCYDVVGSTNNEAKLLAEQGAVHGTLVVSEIQDSGKGRRGRGWSSPPGLGVWMTVILRPDMRPVHASMLTLLAAMAVSDAVLALGLPCQIKWPNDIVIRGKKICGILTEMSTEMESINYVVTGMGINVHNREFPESIADVATSLDMENTGQEPAMTSISRSGLIAAVMEALEMYYEQFLETENLAFIQKEYNKRLVNMGKEVYIFEKDTKRGGLCRGIDETGCLVVEIDGHEEHIVSGEVSVRGVLGYV